MRSWLQENPRPNRPRLQTPWDKGEHDDLDPTSPSHSSGGATSSGDAPKRGAATPPKPSLTHMVRFDTKKGLGLLFHPGPSDKWIGRKVTWEQETGKE